VAADPLLGSWRAEPSQLRLTVRQALVKAPEGTRLLLLVDQFEETFTLCADEAQRRAFITALAGLVDGRIAGQAWWLVSARISTVAALSIPSSSR
jgi:hypothetical protein